MAYALFVGLVLERTISLRDVFAMLIRTGRITGVVFLIIASASILSWWMTFMQIPQQLAAFFLSLSSNPLVIKGLILAFLLAIGMFMDINAALIILTPMLGTLTTAIGMHPVHAGVMIILTLNISLMTPPVGACIFVLSSVTGERIEKISASLWPFIIVEVAVLVTITYCTDLAMFFPKLLLDL